MKKITNMRREISDAKQSSRVTLVELLKTQNIKIDTFCPVYQYLCLQ